MTESSQKGIIVPKNSYYGTSLPSMGNKVLGRVLRFETNGVVVSLPEYLDLEVLVNYRDACKSARIHKIRQSLKVNQEYCFQVKSVDQETNGIGLSRQDLNSDDDREYQKSLRKYLWLFNILKGYFYHHQIPAEEQDQLLEITLWSRSTIKDTGRASMSQDSDEETHTLDPSYESDNIKSDDSKSDVTEHGSKVYSCDCEELCCLFGEIYLGQKTLKEAFPGFPDKHEGLFFEEIRKHLTGYNDFKGVGSLKIMSYGDLGDLHDFAKYLEEHLGTPIFLKSPPNYYFILESIDQREQEAKVEEVKSLITSYLNPNKQLHARFEGFKWTSKFFM